MRAEAVGSDQARDSSRQAALHPVNRFRHRLLPALLAALYCGIWAAIPFAPKNPLISINLNDFDVFFWPSARIALLGHPFGLYSLRYLEIYPNANGPLSMAPLTLLAAVAARLGWLDDTIHRRALVLGVFAVFSLLLASEVVRASDRFLARPLRGWGRLLAYLVILLAPPLWQSVLFYGHIEQPMMLWLALAGVRALAEERPRRAGLLFGLALLTRTSALLYLIPLVLLLLLRERRWRRAALVLGVALGALALGLLPFWLVDRADLLYSLVTYRPLLIVQGGSIWGVFLGGPVEGFARLHDSAVVVACELALVGATLAFRRDLTTRSPGVYALLALCGFCFPLFMKSLWAYYYLEPYTFLAVWWLCAFPVPTRPEEEARVAPYALWGLGLAAPLGVSLLAALADYGYSYAVESVWLPGWSLALFCATLAFTLLIAGWLWFVAPRWPALAQALTTRATRLPLARRLARSAV